MALAVDHQADFQIFRHCQLGKEAASLRDIADAATRHFIRRQARHLDPVAFHPPAAGSDQPHDGLQAGALSGAIAPEQTDNLSGLDRKGDLMKHLRALISRRKTGHRQHQPVPR